MEQSLTEKDQLLLQLGQSRRLAHDVLFRSRHPLKTPQFHYHIIDAFHSTHSQVVIEAFRDAAKSTVAEEAIIIGALYREFKNAVIIGASYNRAKERLTAIKNEFVNNYWINQLFGAMEGPTWGEGRIVLNSGICITALGAGMSMRGTKYLEARPDFALIDDLEDEETVRTPEAREQTMHWLYRTFIPALAKEHRIRFLGNRLDQDAVIVRIAKDPAWRHLRFPIMAQDDMGTERFDLPDGKWLPLWPDKFNLEEIARKRAEYERQGLMHDFNCEYMCEAEDPGTRLFVEGQAKTVARVRVWEATYAAYDPARTAGVKSAMTGKAVFSWINNRLIVWEGDAQLWLPDQIVEDMLGTDDKWQLAELGVESTGLEEFIMQPLRHRAVQRSQLLPIRRLLPPRGKDSFIKGLQPFFKAGEVEFIEVSAEARAQLLSFPTGRKDFPNALAYALMMRPGQPVYDTFSRDNISESLIQTRDPWWLAVNATSQYTTGVLVQVVNGGVRVHEDWIREGGPGEHLCDIVSQARLVSDSPATPANVRLRAPVVDRFSPDTVGLRVVARTNQIEIQNGGDIFKGRELIRQFLGQKKKDQPLFMVSSKARWTLNALSGCYAYELTRKGQMTKEPIVGPYKVLMEGLEAFCAALGVSDSNADARRINYDSGGRAYTTILPQSVSRQELKVGGA